MKIKDFMNIILPWQDLIIYDQYTTDLSEPLFKREMIDGKWNQPNECILEMDIVSIDAKWNTLVLYI